MEAVLNEETNVMESVFKEEDPQRETTKYIENVWMEIKEGTLMKSGVTVIIYDIIQNILGIMIVFALKNIQKMAGSS